MPRLSITAIVPTWNEEDLIQPTLAGLRAGGVDQILVVDGGSGDGTLARARALADGVLQTEGGLFAQLNHAARDASGDVLLFHYADVEFPRFGAEAIERALDRGAVAGAFSLAFASDRMRYRVIARGANLRNRLGLGPFGDQSIFVQKDVFRAAGGFDPGAFLEDLDLVRRLKRAGRFAILDARVKASVRRWEANGFLPTLYEHWRLTLLHLLGTGKRGGKASTRARTLRTTRLPVPPQTVDDAVPERDP